MAGWSEDEKRLVAQMAAKNHTATEIAAALKNRSRNSVIGYLHRSNIPFGKPRPEKKSIDQLRRETQRKMLARRQALAAKRAVVVVPPTRAQFEASQSQSEGPAKQMPRFIDRLQFQCAWIYDEAGTVNSKCCGKVVKEKSSWCPEHYALVYVPFTRKPRSPTSQRDRG